MSHQHPQPPKGFSFFIDGNKFESAQARVTGLQLKSIAGVDATLLLLLEAHGKGPDRQMGDGDVIDLSEHGNEHFYTAPPATYGMVGMFEVGLVG